VTRPVVLANADAGPKSTSLEDLETVFGDVADVVEMGRDLTVDVARAVDAGAPWVGVAGGDGSLRAAAPILMAARRPLLAVPCGTKNHFALAVGTGTLEDAHAAAAGTHTRHVDIGCIGDELFLNTATVGTYAAVVRERDRRAHWPKRLADAAGVLRQAVQGTPYPIDVDGKVRKVWELWAGNGRYGDTLRTLSERDGLESGLLDLRIVLAEHRFARLRLAGAAVASTLGRTPVVERRLVEEVKVASCGEDTALVALDGDAHRVASPMCWRILPRALEVLVPPPS
jgi:diacylglycerol kinase family enzyme